MKNSEKASRILRIFFTRKCNLKFQDLKENLKNHNKGNIEFFHVGESYSLLELTRFDVDIVVDDIDSGEIYTRFDDYFVKCNPF